VDWLKILHFCIQLTGRPKAIGVQDVLTKSEKAATTIVAHFREKAFVVPAQHLNDFQVRHEEMCCLAIIVTRYGLYGV
jgi:hypothetical protein